MPERIIDVAGVVIRFRGDGVAMALIEERYRSFLATAARDAVCDVSVVIDSSATAAEQFGGGELSVESGSQGVTVSGLGIAAQVASDMGAARITTPANAAGVDAVLRFLLARHFLDRGALMVHASAVAIGGRAWVFAGPSGVGKSTLADQLDGELVCDEAVVLAASGDGLEVHATPYWRATPRRMPVAGILFPRRGPAAWQPLSPGQGTSRLLSSVGPFLPGAESRVMEVAVALVESVTLGDLALASISEIRQWLQPLLEAELTS